MTEVVLTTQNEIGEEVLMKTFAFDSKPEARLFIDEHDQEFADDPEIYAVYIK